ncbi:MAG: Xaa-Pro peptidase family protein [Gammaproteobacteria bacterium]|nr:Xaa-Pro peptidase family protein [Gammaproteobacteria bacterium]
MREEIIRRLMPAMIERGLDAVVCLSPENFAYLAGFVVPSQSLMRWRHAAVVVAVDGSCRFLAVDMEESTVKNSVDGEPVRVWGEFTDNPMQVLAGLLKEMGLGSATIGTEMDYLPACDYEALTRAVPGARFVPAEGHLARLRQIKSADEIELMRRLSRIADESISNALNGVGAGSTEMDIAAGLTRNIYSLGAHDYKLMIVATGPRSVFPNVGPTMRRLERQDICRVEIFSVINGYHAGVCRTAYVESPPARSEEIWQNLVECKYKVLDMIKPGASSKEIYEAFIGHLGKLGLPPIQFIGHGIGLHLHEEPYLGMYSDVPLEAGMVLGIEPLVYDTGHGFGMQNKDIVLVTETGSELLSDISDTDALLKVG